MAIRLSNLLPSSDHKLMTPADAVRISAYLLRDASFELTVSQTKQLSEVTGLPNAGQIALTFLPSNTPAEIVGAAARLRAAGFTPVPHVLARALKSARAMEEWLRALAAEAGVSRVLLIAGDLSAARGPFPDTLSVLQTGVLARVGISSVGLAGYPEGHPVASDQQMRSALVAKLAACRNQGIDPWIVTQFCFEAEPIMRYLTNLPTEAQGVPIRIGIAGPSNPATLLKFALRCGVGASMRVLQKSSIGKIARLLNEGRPEGLIAKLGTRLADCPGLGAEGFHIYSFGGLARTVAWRQELLALIGPAGADGLGGPQQPMIGK